MYILIVEDDRLQYNFIRDSLLRIIKQEDLRIERIVSESEFYIKFEDTVLDKPDIIIMDVMLRWADPSPNIPAQPPEVVEQGFYRAGIRCIKMLSEIEETSSIPVIIYSALAEVDLEEEISSLNENVKYLIKDFDPEILKGTIIKLLDIKSERVDSSTDQSWDEWRF